MSKKHDKSSKHKHKLTKKEIKAQNHAKLMQDRAQKFGNNVQANIQGTEQQKKAA